LKARVYQHREKLLPGFTARYNVHKLVYYEVFDDPSIAIAREKQIKAGSRRKKLDLIDAFNPEWQDLHHSYEKIVIASEAKQSRADLGWSRRDCFVAALLAMTSFFS
jgi:putative endonuclease